ncbi:hypothetical protein H2248_003284 [Termitomyces sp. 'cryptogamus']|nr:hypothetical protein H2248_003284 [Termitomyces sp. 'cryptogamus']
MPILLWYTWKNSQDEIWDSAPHVSANKKILTNHSKNQRDLYSAALLLCTGVCLLAMQTISLSQAQLGQDFLLKFCHACIDLKFGPVYGWWLFAFELFNGMLEKINHNGHDGGKMKVTLLCN